jgi:hypothetical protein
MIQDPGSGSASKNFVSKALGNMIRDILTQLHKFFYVFILIINAFKKRINRNNQLHIDSSL